MKRLAGTVLVVVMMVALTACPSPFEQLIAKIRATIPDGGHSSDLIDCTILIGMPTLPTLQHPASNTGMWQVQDSRYGWDVWSRACVGHINPLKIETGDNGALSSTFHLDAVLWPYSEVSRWGTWTTWDSRFFHPNLNMTVWRNTRVVARPLGL